MELNRVFLPLSWFLPVNPLWKSRTHVNRPDLQYPVICRAEECIKAFKNHWFNKQYNLNAVKADLAELFQWCCHHKAVIWGKLAVYEYVNDGVAVNSLLGLLYDNWRIPVNSPRRNTEYQSQISEFYKRLKISVQWTECSMLKSLKSFSVNAKLQLSLTFHPGKEGCLKCFRLRNKGLQKGRTYLIIIARTELGKSHRIR